ncbi:MAG: hypothetical protein IAE87_18290 [Rhodobacteraceae bacterium]|nr:hypothetical protein [Paracoccaceae bacterium]
MKSLTWPAVMKKRIGEPPLVLAMIELDEGFRLMSHVLPAALAEVRQDSWERLVWPQPLRAGSMNVVC